MIATPVAEAGLNNAGDPALNPLVDLFAAVHVHRRARDRAMSRARFHRSVGHRLFTAENVGLARNHNALLVELLRRQRFVAQTLVTLTLQWERTAIGVELVKLQLARAAAEALLANRPGARR
jgi:hypothetical protein